MLQASDRLASRCEPATDDKSQASKVTFAWKNRNRWERLGPDSKIFLACLFKVCVKEHLYRHYLRRQLL